MKKVLLIHNILWSHYKATVFSALNKILSQEHYDFLVLQIASNEKGRKLLGEIDMLIHQYPYKLLFDSSFEEIPKLRKTLRIIREICHFKPDITILPGYSDFSYWVALILARVFLRSKIIVSIDSTELDHPRTWYKELIKKLFMKGSDLSFCYGDQSGKYAIKLGMKPEQVIIRCQATDNDRIESICENARAREEIRRKEGFKPHNFIYVGRLSKEKNPEILLRVFMSLKSEIVDSKDWGLIIVGDGPERNNLMKLANGLSSGEIYFVGGKSWREVPAYYALADVLVLPSLSEPWGLVVNEAMICGLPVIVSDRAGSAYDLVEKNKNGFMFDPYNETELHNNMKYFIRNPEKIKEMGMRSRRIISEFTPQNAARQMFAGIKRLSS